MRKQEQVYCTAGNHLISPADWRSQYNMCAACLDEVNGVPSPRVAKTIISGSSTRQRRVYDICELNQPDGRGIRYHGFVNHMDQGEEIFTVVGATSLESGIWYDINIVGLREVIAQHESEVSRG